MELPLRIKYFDKNIEKLKKTEKGDWIDLRSAIDISLKKGDFALIPLGVGMVLPDGYEAHIVPRSSTFKNWKIIQTNSVGIIDNSYSGENDQWMMPVEILCFTEVDVYAAAFALIVSMTFFIPSQTPISVKISEMLPRSVNGDSSKTERSFIIPL